MGYVIRGTEHCPHDLDIIKSRSLTGMVTGTEPVGDDQTDTQNSDRGERRQVSTQKIYKSTNPTMRRTYSGRRRRYDPGERERPIPRESILGRHHDSYLTLP